MKRAVIIFILSLLVSIGYVGFLNYQLYHPTVNYVTDVNQIQIQHDLTTEELQMQEIEKVVQFGILYLLVFITGLSFAYMESYVGPILCFKRRA